MFATFDYTLYESDSIVKVKFANNVTNDEDFNAFVQEWKNIYALQRDFIFVFDTKQVGFIHIKYSIQMTKFIKKLKKEPHQYLQKSIILVQNNIVKRMLDFIFAIQPPVAPVYLTSNPDHIDILLSNQIPPKTIVIEPGNSMFGL